MCRKKALPRLDTQTDNANDIEAPESPPIPRHVYCNENNSLDSVGEQYHAEIQPITRMASLEMYSPPMRPSVNIMNSISDTHRKATRQYAIRKKKKLIDVFKF